MHHACASFKGNIKYVCSKSFFFKSADAAAGSIDCTKKVLQLISIQILILLVKQMMVLFSTLFLRGSSFKVVGGGRSFTTSYLSHTITRKRRRSQYYWEGEEGIEKKMPIFVLRSDMHLRGSSGCSVVHSKLLPSCVRSCIYIRLSAVGAT